MFRHSKLAIFGGLLLALSQPAMCSLFTGPNTGLGSALFGPAAGHNWDLSGLSAVDTSDGVKITGIMSATITDTGPIGALSTVYLYVIRPFSLDSGSLEVTLRTSLSGMVEYSGGVNITQISTFSHVIGCPSATSWIGNPGQGPISPIPIEQACQVNHSGENTLALDGFVDYVVNGPGTISIDFGNSLLAEVRLNTDPGVPEPSTLWLLSAIIPVALYKRRRVRSQPSTAY